MNVREAKELWANEVTTVEVYKANSRKLSFHPDYCVNIDEIMTWDELDPMEVVKCEIMDKEEYANSILINSCINVDDVFDDGDKILCLLVK
ncbi:MAG: hypothetical protein E7017_07800 [Alphaproteobacteria bacterium]|nr:hypothetical protein [Alphaproteobacteria bacterium]